MLFKLVVHTWQSLLRCHVLKVTAATFNRCHHSLAQCYCYCIYFWIEIICIWNCMNECACVPMFERAWVCTTFRFDKEFQRNLTQFYSMPREEWKQIHSIQNIDRRVMKTVHGFKALNITRGFEWWLCQFALYRTVWNEFWRFETWDQIQIIRIIVFNKTTEYFNLNSLYFCGHMGTHNDSHC